MDNNSFGRPRRIRSNKVLRDLIRENKLGIDDLIMPIFIKSGSNIKNPIISMPGQFQFSIDMLDDEIAAILNCGIKAVIVFGLPMHKDKFGSESYSINGIIQQAIKKIKAIAPNLLVITDICFCQFTNHGHCGVIAEKNDILEIDNDQTLELIVKQAISHAQAGSDMVAPSGMIDGMVKSIRIALDAAGYHHLPILSYAVKYRSAMYGPFADAANGSAKMGDRSGHQMDYANGNEALKEARLDVQEGADFLMVKPAHTYLDIIYRIKHAHPEIPLVAYHVSGEYSMIKAASSNGWIDERKTVIEVLTSMKRAGADIIITYFAKDVAIWIKDGGL